jgi:mono/diheme cytochrome c family protein
MGSRSGGVVILAAALMILAGLAFAWWPEADPGSESPSASPVSDPVDRSSETARPPPDDSASTEEGFSVRRIPWTAVSIDPMPSTPEKLAKAGAGLYQQQCAVCHGAEGKGNGPASGVLAFPPRDFTSGCFKFKTSAQGEMPFDDDLYRTVTSGIPAAGMPSSADLTPFERWALVAYVKTLSKFEHPDGGWLNQFDRCPPKTRLPLPESPAEAKIDLGRGEVLYRDVMQCLKCHGDAGLGDGPSAADLTDYADRPIPAANLTRGDVTFKAGSRPDDIFRVLTIGMSGTPMPSFASLSEEDRWNVAHYVTKKLYRPIDAGERVYLRVGCTSCHTIGKGKLIGPDLAGVTDRRDAGWLKRWLKDPPSMLATDETARKLLEEYLAPMPSYGLTDKEVNLVLDFLRTQKAPAAERKE